MDSPASVFARPLSLWWLLLLPVLFLLGMIWGAHAADADPTWHLSTEPGDYVACIVPNRPEAICWWYVPGGRECSDEKDHRWPARHSLNALVCFPGDRDQVD